MLQDIDKIAQKLKIEKVKDYELPAISINNYSLEEILLKMVERIEELETTPWKRFLKFIKWGDL